MTGYLIVLWAFLKSHSNQTTLGSFAKWESIEKGRETDVKWLGSRVLEAANKKKLQKVLEHWAPISQNNNKAGQPLSDFLTFLGQLVG